MEKLVWTPFSHLEYWVVLDLIVLAADLDMEYALQGIFASHKKFGITNEFSYEIVRHRRRDNGCYNEGVDFLRNYQSDYNYALLIFDYDGCGAKETVTDVGNKLSQQLITSGWRTRDNTPRAGVVVIHPELEVWVWSDSPHVATVLGWDNMTELKTWLFDHGWWSKEDPKPTAPKEAYEKAMRVVGTSRTAATFKKLAENVSFTRCTDPSFLRLKSYLQTWFG